MTATPAPAGVARDTAAVGAWLRSGTDVLLQTVAGLDDAAWADPSLLPGWSRSHVVGHLARNAEALSRLVHWAATGEVTPMYSGPEQRAADIETSAALPPTRLRAELSATARRLAADLAALDGPAAEAIVRGATGREFPAGEIGWLRVREVWLHAVDLDAGVMIDDLPAPLVDALLDDVTATLGSRADCPPAILHALDRAEGTRVLRHADAATVIRGSAADLAAFLTGRSDGRGLTGDRCLPRLPRWL